MEFPHLGEHCSEPSCRQLDFLPVRCDGCSNIFCSDHFKYSAHSCPAAYKKDVQVPLCPLCGIAVPFKKSEAPDIRMSEHIDNNCTSDVALSKRKVYTNKCSFRGCKVKEMVRVECPECRQNFCLKHRHTADHKCDRRPPPGGGKAGEAALKRLKASQTGTPRAQSSLGGQASIMPNGITEEEALAMALAESAGGSVEGVQGASMAVGATNQVVPGGLLSDLPQSREEEERMLAEALRRTASETQQNKKSCALS
ncbi:unnamed protein product [Cyprideis torosa]|uniref:Uncharacterized protein n=1 Tax=Cyprideis torosa TaxID=163714 RepID=A0A7R8WEK6_9CRUS|nr:unnamed protein product [Cyprideis torosa]CAG0894454.1 unnamed protein product [Cyprideis torosa]